MSVTPDNPVSARVVACMAHLRRQYGYTQGAFAERCGISRSALARMESGERLAVTVDELVSIANALDVAPASMLSGAPAAQAAALRAKADRLIRQAEALEAGTS